MNTICCPSKSDAAAGKLLPHTSREQARFALCTSSRAVDHIALLIVGRVGVAQVMWPMGQCFPEGPYWVAL